MITFKQDGDTLKPYWTTGGEISAKDWKKISAGVNRYFKPVKPKALVILESAEIELTNLLYTKVKENFNFLVEKPTPQREYLEMKQLLKAQDPRMVRAVILWSQQDSFWKQNIRSVKKLRAKFDDLLIRAMSESKANQNKVVSV